MSPAFAGAQTSPARGYGGCSEPLHPTEYLSHSRPPQAAPLAGVPLTPGGDPPTCPHRVALLLPEALGGGRPPTQCRAGKADVPSISPRSAALAPPSLPGRPTSCCRPEPREHHELVAVLSHPVPSASPALQQPSLPAFTPHTCIPVPIKACIKPAPCPCLLGHHRGGAPVG